MDSNYPFDPVREFHNRYLNAARQLTEHPKIAVAAALDYCAEEDIEPPKWLVVAASKLLTALLLREKPTKRGRANGAVARYGQDLVEYERWDTVSEARRNQKSVQERFEFFLSHPTYRKKAPEYFKAEEKMAAWAGKDWLRAYECAAMLLKGRQAFAGPETVKKSYIKVQAHFKDEDASKRRYFRLDERFLRKIGIPHILDRAKGTNILPIYNLTL